MGSKSPTPPPKDCHAKPSLPPPRPPFASHCSSGSAESQDGVNAMCAAIAAFKPVCDDIVNRFESKMMMKMKNINDHELMMATLKDVMREKLYELLDKASSSPA